MHLQSIHSTSESTKVKGITTAPSNPPQDSYIRRGICNHIDLYPNALGLQPLIYPYHIPHIFEFYRVL